MAAASFLLLLTAACSNQKQQVVRPASEPTVHKINVIEYFVLPGDSLSKISLKLTEDVKNWKEIGQFNGVYDPSALQTGASLLIPEHLVTTSTAPYERSVMTLHLGPSKSATASNSQTKPKRQPIAIAKAGSTMTQQPVALNRKPVFQPESLPGAPRITPATRRVNVNREFQVTYFDAAANGEIGNSRMIKVVGTYYPKGIYSEPVGSSSLLMRVAPGSTFVYEESIGEWIKIRTETGTGYIRKIDAKILGSNSNQTRVITTSL